MRNVGDQRGGEGMNRGGDRNATGSTAGQGGRSGGAMQQGGERGGRN